MGTVGMIAAVCLWAAGREWRGPVAAVPLSLVGPFDGSANVLRRWSAGAREGVAMAGRSAAARVGRPCPGRSRPDPLVHPPPPPPPAHFLALSVSMFAPFLVSVCVSV